MYPLISCTEKITCVVFLSKMHNLNLVMRRRQTKPNRDTFHKTTNRYSSKVSVSWRTGELSQIGGHYRDGTMKCMWDSGWILKQKRHISGKTGDIPVTPLTVWLKCFSEVNIWVLILVLLNILVMCDVSIRAREGKSAPECPVLFFQCLYKSKIISKPVL